MAVTHTTVLVQVMLAWPSLLVVMVMCVHKTGSCPYPINNHVKMHVSTDGLVQVKANSSKACCLLCSKSPTCSTWCYGWPAPYTCHMSPGPALNKTAAKGFASGTSPNPAPSPSAGTRPHIVVFIADDLGFANVQYSRAYYGATAAEVRTPNIDGLVAEGIELARNYVYKVCSPTRSSFQSGRLPVHVNTANLSPTVTNPHDPVSGFAGIPANMTCIANKLKQAGYKTHQIGKWDVGMATARHTPAGRGYDTSFGYFFHDNDYWTETNWATFNDSGYSKRCNATFVDLWRFNATATGSLGVGVGAVGENGTRPMGCSTASALGCNSSTVLPWGVNGSVAAFESTKFQAEALALIDRHDPSTPLFLNYDFHIAHEPIELPRTHFERQRLLTAASGVGDFLHRRTTYQGMVNFLDAVIGNVTAKLKAKGMWNDTLYVFSSDNGGPSFDGSHHLAANNWPLRGGKTTDFEGGVRVLGIPAMVGQRLTGLVHIADWYATLCALAGVSPHDAEAKAMGLPAPDSLNLWPYLSGNISESPRTHIHLSEEALVMGRYKLIRTNEEMRACWSGPLYPNASQNLYNNSGPFLSPCQPTRVCAGDGCLFDVVEDPSERSNLALDPAHSNVLITMQQRLEEENRNNFKPNRGTFDQRVCAAAEKVGGYWGPFI